MAQRATAARRATRNEPSRRTALRVVAAPETRANVGVIGSFLAVVVFATMLAIAALHAVLVQTQAGLEDLRVATSEQRDRVHELQAEIARLDSPDGVATLARDHGLVAVTDVGQLVQLPTGALAPPSSADPFAGGGAG